MASEEEKADKAAAERCPEGICRAAECGNLPALRHFLRVDPESVHEKDEKFGSTPLRWAVFNGHVEAAEFLLSKGAALDAKNDVGSTPLHLAAYNGHAKAAEFLLSKGAAVDAKNDKGDMVLHLAAWNGHVEAAEFLLSKGAAVDAKNNDGKTPLDFARERGKTEMVQFLLNTSAKKASAKDGKTPPDLSSKGKAEMKPLPTAADKTSEAGKKAQQTPVFEFSSPRQTSKEEAAPHAAGSGAAAVKHQREASKEEAKKPSAEDGKAPVHRADKASEEVKKTGKTTAAPAEGNQDDPEVERDRAPCATHGGGTTIVPDTSAVEIPMGEGTPVAMFSLRFDGGPTEQKMRRVHKILVDNSYNALMVQVNGGESFGVLTARYLNKLKVGKGLMIAVCTHHYGEMTSSKFCSYYELKFAVTNGIAVLPLRVEETYPPQPPCGKDHLDKECDAQGFIGMTFGDDVLYVDCRTMSEMDIAHAIATRLHQLRDERQGS